MERSKVPPPALPRSGWPITLPFYYGWVVVGSIFVAQSIAYGVYYAFSVFFVAVIEEFGWSRGPTAGVFSVFVVVIGVGGIAAGALIDRFGPSRVVPAGGVLLAVGLFATSRVSELWQFYLFFGVVSALGVSLCGWVPCVTVTSRWFSAKRGKALGIVAAGVGLGIVGMVPFCQYLISNLGWRSAFVILAGLALFGIGPQAALLQVGRPEDLGLRPDGTSETGSSDGPRGSERAREMVVVDQKWASFPWSVQTAMRTHRFWLLAGNTTLTVLTTQMLWVHQVAYLVDGGYDRMLAASVVSLAGLVSMPAKVLWGLICDRLGREISMSIGTSTVVLSMGLLGLMRAVPEPWLVFLFAVTFAAGYAASAPVGPAAAADIFAGRSFGAIYGILSLATGLGAATGATMAGYIFDVTGSYLAAFAAAAASSFVGVGFMWLAAPRKVRRVPAPGK